MNTIGGVNFSKLIVYLGLVVFFIFSANLEIHKIIKPYFGILNSYLIDQFIFYYFLLIFLIYGFATKRLLFNFTDLLVLTFFLLIPFLTHSEILDRYFYKEDFFYNLSALRTATSSEFYLIGTYFFVYPFLPIVVIYKFFVNSIFPYNLSTLILLAFSAFLLYKTVTLVFTKNNNFTKLIAFLMAFAYLTSPTYLDAYLWISVGLEGGLMYSLMLLGIIFYMLFLRKGDDYYFLGAFIILLISLKTGFARVGFLPLIFILFEFSFFSKKEIKKALVRIILLIIPTSWFLFNSGHLQQIFFPPSERNTGLAENLYVLLAHLPHALIPFEVLVSIYKKYQISFLSQIYPLEFNFYFTFGVIICILILFWSLFIKNKIVLKFLIVFTLSSLICLFFFVNFGSLGNIGDKTKFDKNLSAYSITIGHRYYQGVNILLSISISILLILLINKYPKLSILSSGLLITLIVYNISIMKTHNSVFIKDYAAHNKAFYEGVLRLVPSDTNRKILYFKNGEKWRNKVHAFDHYLGAFYPPNTLTLVNNEAELNDNLQKGGYEIENLYAIYLDDPTLRVQNLTDEFRYKLLSNK